MIEFSCEKCGHHMRAKDEYAGRKAKCPRCQEVFTIPGPSVAASDFSPQTAPPEPPAPLPVAPPAVAAAPPPPPADLTPAPAAGPTHVHVHADGRPTKGTSGFGVAALVLGIIACLTCWIPFVGLLSIPLSVLGAIFGVVGIIVSATGRRSGIGMPVAGASVCVVAIIIAILSTGGAAVAIDQSVKEMERSLDEATKEMAEEEAGQREQPTAPGNEAGGKAPAERPWPSAKVPLRHGDVQVRIVSVNIGKVEIQDLIRDGTSISKDSLLSIKVEVRNLSETKKLGYRTWAGRDLSFGKDFATLEDNFGNSYKRVTFGMDQPKGRVMSESLYPGKPLTDVLVFETPIEKAQYLRLELPAGNVDGEGVLRFQIPMTMIKR